MLSSFGQYRQLPSRLRSQLRDTQSHRDTESHRVTSKLENQPLSEQWENLDQPARQMNCVMRAEIVRCYATECPTAEHQ